MDYNNFIKTKKIKSFYCGKTINKESVNKNLFDFQKDIVFWAVKKGRCALFLDTGLGKTHCQTEWARLISEKRSLIVSPLSVARQTIRLAKKITNTDVYYTRSSNDIIDGINITNYEMIEHFDASLFDAVILDESSILQSNKNGQEWRLRNYGVADFYKWLSTWAIALKKPSDLGYEAKGYDLPKLNINPIFIPVDYQPEGLLFFIKLKGIKDRTIIRKDTAVNKINNVVDIVKSNNEQWIIWCGLNTESNRLKKVIQGSIEISGSDSAETKAKAIEDFQDGKTRILITKPRIAGFGMNFQNAHNMIFCGLSDSWEAYYQCIRRQWRFGQTKEVNVYIVLTDVEKEILTNVMNKDKMANRMTSEMIKHIKIFEEEELKGMEHKTEEIKTERVQGDNFTAYRGDSCQLLRELKDESVDLSVYSPPFADLYTYSSSEYDLGNSKNWDEFFKHYSFIISEIYRVTKRGRISCVHTSDIAAMAMKDGYIGLKDFPGAVIRAHEAAGWIYHGYAIVSKNPQAQAIRTHSKALLFVQMKKDSSCSRPAILDRVLFFKKPGDSETSVIPVVNGEMDNETWINWAGGIWTGINESDTLQFTTARDKNDEKHICPLQIGTIDRCIKLYSNPGETVLTPFMGIGSEAYQALKLKRKAIGIELKESYFKIALKNLIDIEDKTKENTLFSNAF